MGLSRINLPYLFKERLDFVAILRHLQKPTYMYCNMSLHVGVKGVESSPLKDPGSIARCVLISTSAKTVSYAARLTTTSLSV